MRIMTGCSHFRFQKASTASVAAGEVALMHCCSATESSEMPTLVQPRSTAIAAQMPAKSGRRSRAMRENRAFLESKMMGTRQILVARQLMTEKATGVLILLKTSLVSSVLDTATKTRKASAKAAARFSPRIESQTLARSPARPPDGGRSMEATSDSSLAMAALSMAASASPSVELRFATAERNDSDILRRSREKMATRDCAGQQVSLAETPGFAAPGPLR